jgi:anti-sigma B factor antagonist
MQITKSDEGSWVVLTLMGKLDNTGAAELETALTPLLTGGSLALDFSGVEYVTSSGFRSLMIGLKQQTAKQGKFVLVGMSDPVRRFFDIAGLGRVFKIETDLQAVIKAGP